MSEQANDTRHEDERRGETAPPAQHEVKQAGTPMLPGLEDVAERPAERGYPG